MRKDENVSWSVGTVGEQVVLKVGRQENFMSPQVAEEMSELLQENADELTESAITN